MSRGWVSAEEGKVNLVDHDLQILMVLCRKMSNCLC